MLIWSLHQSTDSESNTCDRQTRITDCEVCISCIECYLMITLVYVAVLTGCVWDPICSYAWRPTGSAASGNGHWRLSGWSEWRFSWQRLWEWDRWTSDWVSAWTTTSWTTTTGLSVLYLRDNLWLINSFFFFQVRCQLHHSERVQVCEVEAVVQSCRMIITINSCAQCSTEDKDKAGGHLHQLNWVQ